MSASLAGCGSSALSSLPQAATTPSQASHALDYTARAYALASSAPATPAPAPGVYDNFESDAIGASAANVTTLAGSWAVCKTGYSSRELCSTSAAPSVAVIGNPNWANYTYDAYVADTDLTSGEASIVGRVLDTANYYQLRVGPSATGTPAWTLSRTVGGVRTSLASGSIATVTNPYYHLRMKFAGSTISAYLAQNYASSYTTLATVTDSSFASGLAGLATSGGSAYRFDNVDVTGATALATPAPASPTPIASASPSTQPSGSPSPTPVKTASASPTPVAPSPTATATASTQPIAGMAATSADAFVTSMGVDVDLTTPPTSAFPKLGAAFAGLGVRHTRISVLKNDPTYEANVRTFFGPNPNVKAYGITDCAPKLGGSANAGITPADLTGFQNRTGGHIDMVEGINEPNLRPDSNWVADTKTCMAPLKGVLPGIPLAAPAISVAYQGAAPTALGNVSSLVAYGNMHRYFAGRNPATTGWGGVDNCGTYGDLKWSLCWAQINTPGEPIVVTETGWNSVKEVDELTQAKYAERLFFVNAQAGIVATSLYMLGDTGVNEDGFGGDSLLRSDFSHKPAYTAIANMTSLLSDPGAPFTAAALPLTISPKPVTTAMGLRAMLLGKRDGSYDLAIWQEVQSANPDQRGTDTIPATRNATLTLATSRTATLHAWQDDGSTTTTAAGAGTKFVVPVTDRLTIVELR